MSCTVYSVGNYPNHSAVRTKDRRSTIARYNRHCEPFQSFVGVYIGGILGSFDNIQSTNQLAWRIDSSAGSVHEQPLAYNCWPRLQQVLPLDVMSEGGSI